MRIRVGRERCALAAVVGVVVLAGAVAQGQEPPTLKPITQQDLLDGLKDPTRWLTFGGDYGNQRYSPLKQITPKNVKQLVPQWMFQTETTVPGRGFEAMPLVADGVMYVSGTNNGVWALDEHTGRMLWRYKRTFPKVMRVCCGAVNRGLAMLGDRLYMGTLDAHLVALDRATGKVVWDVPVEEPTHGFSIDGAPIIANGKVIIGIAGGDYNTRGFLDAYDAETGARAWRLYTIPAAGEPGSETWPNADAASWGGGATWVTGAYDPELNLVYVGTGNPNPNFFGDDRKGDDLYTCSLLAIDVATGTLKWHYQFTPHDTHDWDSTEVPILGTVKIDGRDRKVVMLANRNGFFYTLDRETGKLLVAKPFTTNATNWAKEIGPDGRPVVVDELGTDDKCLPDFRGGTNFQPPAFNPDRRLFFVTARETCVVYTPRKPEKILPGGFSPSGSIRHIKDREQYGALRAISPATGKIVWEHRYPGYPSTVTLDLTGGVTTTASGLVFTGDNEGFLNAFDADSGALLWRYQTGAPVWGAAPVTYMLDGRQHVAIASGIAIITFALPPSAGPGAR